MARAGAVLAALAVCMARADVYGGGRMPHYDAAEDAAVAALQFGGGGDYRGHSPDASAPLDYKDEEDAQGDPEKFTKVVESKSWKRPARKQRGPRSERDEPSEDVDAAAEPFLDSEPRRRRTRGPSDDGGGSVAGRSRGHPEPARSRHRRRRRRGRTRNDDARQMHFLNADYRVVKNDLLGDDVDSFTSGETTEVIIHRKPRARLFDDEHVKPFKSDDSYMERDLISDRRLKGDRSMEPDEMEYEERRRAVELARRPPVPAPRDADADADADAGEEAAAESDAAPQRAPLRPKEHRDYGYYDSKMLVRRTTTRAASHDAPTAPFAADLPAQLWTARRAQPPEGTPLARRTGDADPPASTATTSPTSRSTSSEFTSELSIAEKSRLSILKKSQKKERDENDPSKKPPVLLQVTSEPATMVMVEPPTRADPWLRARRVTGDSPRRLDKVKRLMRHKLVAGAKSIQELTDNWDDMVCDYIDVSLLDAALRLQPGAVTRPLLACLTYAIVFVIR